jgi:hypothetical protein
VKTVGSVVPEVNVMNDGYWFGSVQSVGRPKVGGAEVHGW